MSAQSRQSGPPTSGPQPTDDDASVSTGRSASETDEVDRRVQLEDKPDDSEQLTDRTTAGSGGSARHRPTLLSWIEEEAQMSTETRELVAAAHIVKWTKRFATQGLVNSELRRLRVVSAPKPVPFLFLDETDSRVKVIHSFGRVTLEDRDAEGEGNFVGFVGDRRQTRLGGWKDPLPFGVSSQIDSFTMVSMKTVTQAVCDKAKQEDWTTLMEASASAKTVDVPRLMPIPSLWLEFFLAKDRYPLEAYNYLKKETKSWDKRDEAFKRARRVALDWTRAAATGIAKKAAAEKKDAHQVESDEEVEDQQLEASPMKCTGFDIAVLHGACELWAEDHLLHFLPLKPAAPANGGAPPGSLLVEQALATTAAAVDRLAMLSADQEQRTTEHMERLRDRADGNTVSRTLSDIKLARLLGHAGLGWEERGELPPWFAKIHAQTDTTSKELVVKEMFSALGATDPFFKTFQNSKLVDDIIAHKFVPGMTAEDAHRGMSLLAFSTRSANAIKTEKDEDEHYKEANTKTPEHVRKHKRGKAVPLATQLAEVIRQASRYTLVLCTLWGEYCDLFRQLDEMRDNLELAESEFMNNEDAVEKLIPAVYWAIQLAANRFFKQASTLEELKRARPKTVRCDLKIHAQQLTSGQVVEFHGMPESWKPRQHQAPPKPPPQGGGRKRPERDRYGREDNDPFDRKPRAYSGGAGSGNQQEAPTPFSQSAEVDELLRKTGNRISLSLLIKKNGYDSVEDLSRKCGFHPNKCLRRICFGKCSISSCDRDHSPGAAPAVDKLFAEVIPAVRKELATLNKNKKPRN